MSGRRGLALAGGLIAVGVMIWLGRGGKKLPGEQAAGREPVAEAILAQKGTRATSPTAPRPTPLDPARVTVLARTDDDFIEWPASAEAARSLNAPEQSAAEDIQMVESLFADYRAVYGENPLGGLNEEITAGLRGDNPRKIRFLPDEPARFNSRGELLDRWGTPYFFHKLSGLFMEVRSAGPDRRPGTGDDVGETVEGGPPR